MSLPASSPSSAVFSRTVSNPLSPPRTTGYHCCRRSFLFSAAFGVALGMTFAQITWSMIHGSRYTSTIAANQNSYHDYYSIGSKTSPDFFHPFTPPTQTNQITANLSLVTTTTQNRPTTTEISSISKWFMSRETKTQIHKHKIVDQQLEADPRPFITIVMCVRSKPEWKHVNQTTLFTLLLPSIQKTVTAEEWRTFRIEALIGFDVGDKFWEDQQHRDFVQRTFAKRLPRLGINFLELTKQRPHQIPFNSACRAAYELGSDYIVRINDDTEFLTSQWISQGVQQLNQFHPSKLGVVGPKCRQGNKLILTHDMVHRLHLDIFGMEYYPNEFDNWWIDNWISQVYGLSNTKRINSWEVHHHTKKHGTRYHVDPRLKTHLATTLRKGGQKIQSYLKQKQDNGTDSLGIPKSQMKFQVLGTNRIPAAWGPSVDPFYKN